MKNRLYPEEEKILEKLRQYMNHMTPENERHMKSAGREYIRWKQEQEKAA